MPASIRELKAALDRRGVSHAHCTEKHELVELLAAATAAAPSSTSSSPPAADDSASSTYSRGEVHRAQKFSPPPRNLYHPPHHQCALAPRNACPK